MKNKKKRRGGKIYAICLAVYTLLLAGAACYGLSFVWDYAEEYELSRPDRAMEAYVADLNENLWDDSISQTISDMPHEMQSDAECAEIVKDMLSNGLTYVRKAGSGNEDEVESISYSLRCNGSEFGVITLMHDVSKEDEVKFGMLPWIVAKEEFDFTGLYSSVEVTVPESYTVKLNGKKLSKEYIVEDGIKYDVLEDYYEIHDGLPTKVTYRFENIFGTLEPEIFDEDDNPFVIDETLDDSQYIKDCSQNQLNKLSDFAKTFCTRYFEFTTGIYDPSYGYQRLLPYMKLGSDLDDRMKQALDGLSWANTSVLRMDSVTLNGAIDIGENYYIIDVTSQTTTVEPSRGEVVGVHNMKILVVDNVTDIRAITLDRY